MTEIYLFSAAIRRRKQVNFDIHNIMYPTLYHAHHSRHMEDLPFWQALAEKQGGLALELGCGTGRLLQPMAAAGLQVFGLDLDRETLRFLLKNYPPGRVIQADMANLCVKQGFSLVFVPCNTFSIFSKGTRQKILEGVKRCLLPGGIFAASFPNPKALKAMPALGEPEFEESFPHPVTGEPVQVSSAWKRTYKRFILAWIYDCLRPDGSLERITAQVSHSLEPVDVYEQALAGAGLRLTARYGDYDGSAYDEESPSCILVAKSAK